MCLKQKITLALLSVSINQHLPNKKLLNLLANIHYFFLISHSLSFSLLLSLTKHTRTLPYTHRCIHAHIHALEETPTHMQQLSSNKKGTHCSLKKLTNSHPSTMSGTMNQPARTPTHTHTHTHTYNKQHSHALAGRRPSNACLYLRLSLAFCHTNTLHMKKFTDT